MDIVNVFEFVPMLCYNGIVAVAYADNTFCLENACCYVSEHLVVFLQVIVFSVVCTSATL